jgi:hypothetical protein
MVNTLNLPKTLAIKGVVFVILCFTISSIVLLTSCNIETVNLPYALLLCPLVHCSITIDWPLVRSKLSIKLILSESQSSLKNSPASTTDFGQLVLVDLDVGKPVKRTAVGFTLCREEYKLEISASETDLWSSLLGSYFSLK